MSSTYSQIYIQIVFAVKGRRKLIHTDWEEDLYKYITGVVTSKGQKLIAINGMPDHIHILIGMKATCCLSDLVREIKKASTRFINHNRHTSVPFQWQEGYGAFSYSQSSLDSVVLYIQNQKQHHLKNSSKDEFKAFLTNFNVDYKDEFIE